MKKSRYSEAQIVAVLKEAENGVPVTASVRTAAVLSVSVLLHAATWPSASEIMLV